MAPDLSVCSAIGQELGQLLCFYRRFKTQYGLNQTLLGF